MYRKPTKQLPPTYDLEEIKVLLSDPGTRVITRRDRKEAANLGYPGDKEMAARVMQIRKTEFYKTMECEDVQFAGLWQDVYKTLEPSGIKLYIKLQKNDDGDGVLISFKKDTGVY